MDTEEISTKFGMDGLCSLIEVSTEDVVAFAVLYRVPPRLPYSSINQ